MRYGVKLISTSHESYMTSGNQRLSNNAVLKRLLDKVRNGDTDCFICNHMKTKLNFDVQTMPAEKRPFPSCIAKFKATKIKLPTPTKSPDQEQEASNLNQCEPSVAFHTETSNLICTVNQMTGFYMKYKIRLKWVTRLYVKK